MLSENTRLFTKDNLDLYLKELAKEYRHLNGKNVEAEIIMVGGAAILANYGFREMTTDVDAIIHASSSMKEAINRTGDKFNLPNGWLNADFMRTVSYSPKLNLHSKHYKIFSGVLRVRIVSAEYLVAMKLKSGRDYKHDLSDIVGILAEHTGPWGLSGHLTFAVNELHKRKVVFTSNLSIVLTKCRCNVYDTRTV